MRFVRFLAATLLALSAPAMAQMSGVLQCVTYARAASGIELRGNAQDWWDRAEGRYERGQTPRVGAVMAMPSFAGMRYGHVAMVSKVVSTREILLSHANWSRPGMVERDVLAVDVSEKGDWSRVRIWHGGSAKLGITSYPVSGFIYNSTPDYRVASKAGSTGLQLSEDVRALAARQG
ncbi:MAG: CHAP domain-containing protein [Chakrabartia sp.]